MVLMCQNSEMYKTPIQTYSVPVIITVFFFLASCEILLFSQVLVSNGRSKSFKLVGFSFTL